MNCKVCSKEAIEIGFCALHLKAYENIVGKYDVWKKALGLSWKEYLREIEKNSLIGEWAKEVTTYLIRDEETQSVKET